MPRLHVGPRRLTPVQRARGRPALPPHRPPAAQPDGRRRDRGRRPGRAARRRDVRRAPRALLDYKVIFFRDQDITTEQHLAFARRFGELETHPFVPAQRRAIPRSCCSRRTSRWAATRTSGTATSPGACEPSLGSVLRARRGAGGRRRHALLRHVRRLRGPRRRRAAHRSTALRAVHDFTRTFGRMLDAEELAEKQRGVSRRPSTRSCARIRRPAARRST